jgi:hypothetical protein
MKPSEIRNLFETALPEAAHSETGELAPIYMPSAHYKAIALDRPLVVGDRGAGKSYWLKNLVNPKRRALIASVFGIPALSQCDVMTGFDPSATGNYPEARELAALIQSSVEPSDVWHTVMVQACLPTIIPPEIDSWSAKIKWVNSQPEVVAKHLRNKNAMLVAEGKSLLVAFDGLDRLASTWKSTVVLARGLLQTQLDFSKYTHLRTKAFIRPDLFSAPEIRRFPDASKLVSLAVKLKWDAIDLYGLMWQYLANSDDVTASAFFRTFCEESGQFNWSSNDNELFFLSEEVKNDELKQQALFHKIAGRTMGGKTGGNTWTWLPNHLSDAYGYTSPRSFLVALRSAAVDSKKRKFLGPEYALHTASIKEGVSSASEVRRNELTEDFPWIQDIFAPLKGLPLPARRQDIVGRWRKENTIAALHESTYSEVPLPEKISKDEPSSILLALEELGLCRKLDDGRIDFPDIVRVNAGMTRKGGVPVRR